MSEMRKIRVLIADDFDIMCQVIYRLIERSEDIEVVGDSPHLREALREASSLAPDVILMNDYLPPTTSVEAAKLFREMNIAAAILIISMHVEPEMIRDSLANGANGFMHKSEMGDLLIAAIRRVYSQEQYLSPLAAAALSPQSDE